MNLITDNELRQYFQPNIASIVIPNRAVSVIDILNETIYDITREQILEATSIARSIRDQAKSIINGVPFATIDWAGIRMIDVKTAHKICAWSKNWDKFLSRKLAWYDKQVKFGLIKE